MSIAIDLRVKKKTLLTLCPVTYFRGRGRAEVIRWNLAACGIPFTHRILETPDDLKKLREAGELLFGQLPLLEINGQKLVRLYCTCPTETFVPTLIAQVQTAATCRAVARLGKLYPEQELSWSDIATIDMICEAARDIAEPALSAPFRARTEEDMEKYREEVLHPHLRKFAPYLEKLLLKNKPRVFFVGDSPTLADILVAEALHSYEDALGRPCLEEFPDLYANVQATMSISGIANYLSGKLRHPPSGPVYVAHVDKVLDR